MTAALVIAVIGSVFMFCQFCGKRTRHTISQSSKFYRDYKCEGCNIVTKYKVK